MATVRDRAAALKKWLDEVEDLGLTPNDRSDINRAIYTLNQGHGWPEHIELRNPKTVIMCWRLVERVRRLGLMERMPERFRL